MSTIDRVDASTRVAHRVYARLSHSRGLYEHCGDGVHAPVLPAQRMQGSAGAATRDPLVAAKSESVRSQRQQHFRWAVRIRLLWAIRHSRRTPVAAVSETALIARRASGSRRCPRSLARIGEELRPDRGRDRRARRKRQSREVAYPAVTGTRHTREPIGFSSVDARSPWRGITASSRASRSGRSPTVSVALRRRSRRTSTTRPARRRGRSRPATWAYAAAAARIRSRATARATRTPIASAAIPARSTGAGPGTW